MAALVEPLQTPSTATSTKPRRAALPMIVIGVVLAGAGAAASFFLTRAETEPVDPVPIAASEPSSNTTPAAAVQAPAKVVAPDLRDETANAGAQAPSTEPTALRRLFQPADDCTTATDCNTRGHRFYQAKDYRAALPYFAAALEYDPGHVKARYNAACMFALLEEPEASLALLSQLAAMNDPDAKNRIMKVSTDPDFDRIRPLPAFRRELARLQEKVR